MIDLIRKQYSIKMVTRSIARFSNKYKINEELGSLPSSSRKGSIGSAASYGSYGSYGSSIGKRPLHNLRNTKALARAQRSAYANLKGRLLLAGSRTPVPST